MKWTWASGDEITHDLSSDVSLMFSNITKFNECSQS